MCKVPNENLNSADNLTDENLCRMVASGDRRAEEILVSRYTRLVRTCARPYFLAGGDSEDLTQEDIKAAFNDGVLKLIVPKEIKKVEEEPKFITIE